jgi:hypothetical protein
VSVLTKLAAFSAALLVAFAVAVGVGRLSGVDGRETGDTTQIDHAADDMAMADSDAGHNEHAADESAEAAEASVPGGLEVAQDGYAIELLDHAEEPGREQPLEFRITGPDGAPVTGFTPTHEAELHLIVVRRDLTGYQHVHPTMDADGTWSIPFSFDQAGTYRVFADFMPDGADSAMTLGVDVAVAGEFTPEPLAAPSPTAEIDGYTVTLDGDILAGDESTLTLSVRLDGEPVTDLQPYLGAYGHLVALRDGDVAYLHVHPEGEPDDGRTAPGPEVSFVVEVPSEGAYRLYFDFRHDNTVRTVEFTVETNHDD